MDHEIFYTDNKFDFSKLSITQPVSIQGGAYFTKIKMNDNPLYIQTSKCYTKQGLNETNKKAYLDLMFSKDDDTVIEWFENLEAKLVDLIDGKKYMVSK